MTEKGFQRNDIVLAAALDEFTTNNYETASLNTIIKSAGISKGVFYYHYENKEALYLSLLKSCTDAKWQYIREQTTLHKVDFDKMDIFDKFLYQAELGIGFATQYPSYHILGRMFAKEQNTPIYKTAIDYLGISSPDSMASMIHDAIKRRELKLEFDEAFLVRLLKFLFQEFDQIFDQDSNCDKDVLMMNLKNYVNFIRYGLKASTND